MTTLKNIISSYVDKPHSAKDKKDLKNLLEQENNITLLEYLGQEYFPDTEVSIPIYERILELKPNNIETIISIGSLFWLDGEYDESQKRLEIVKKMDPERVDVMGFEALITSNLYKKIELYKKILKKDPTSENALALLKQTESQIKEEGGWKLVNGLPILYLKS
ncbi:hypothetical protein IQ249_20600 [Lusitaniella coriacea LEGE 07157]|uniref:Tetratricopeptide repeat protein n=1 Tax=Lusitaniella coriacea LEGE 07157 TaxID=945747 RepID=A0A8J7DZ75_9CYAN|nr:hypothetical protein [Lusitaniella coriacea]MBE9118296.1 hypothetical protein [Lusitaniella coriacea LEGE 07157]